MTTSTSTPVRNYDAIAATLTHRVKPGMSREDRMQLFVDVLWDALHESNVSWVGFYLENPDSDDMILGPRRDKPACSPIAMFGACGQSLASRKALVVTNVSNLRGYIACDPRDRSELVIPVLETFDHPYGVLDLDSHQIHAFDRNDAHALHRLLQIAGLTPNLALGDVETV